MAMTLACPECGGFGLVPAFDYDGAEYSATCPECAGLGFYHRLLPAEQTDHPPVGDRATVSTGAAAVLSLFDPSGHDLSLPGPGRRAGGPTAVPPARHPTPVRASAAADCVRDGGAAPAAIPGLSAQPGAGQLGPSCGAGPASLPAQRPREVAMNRWGFHSESEVC